MTKKRYTSSHSATRPSAGSRSAGSRSAGVPTWEALPTPRPRPMARFAGVAQLTKKGVDTAPHQPVQSNNDGSMTEPVMETQNQEKKKMNLTRNSRQPAKAKVVTYGISGYRGVARFPKNWFTDGGPETLSVPDEGFAASATKKLKVKLTKEERKALNAAKTPAEKLAAQEARLAKQVANLAARKARLEATM